MSWRGTLSADGTRFLIRLALLFGTFFALASFAQVRSIAADDDSPPISAVVPVELRVPAAGIDAHVQQVGTTDDGSMDVPSNFSDVAWFAPGYRPGEYGSAVFDGHVSNVDSAAVFFYVEDLAPGNKVYVKGDDGTELMFQVTAVKSYPLDGAPMDEIFGSTDWPRLALITCGGDWHEDIHLFDHRTVVYASLVSVVSN
jgi:sortase A